MMDSDPTDNMQVTAPNAIASRVFSIRSFQRPRKGPVLPLLRMTKHEPASLSTDSCDTFPSPACSSLEVRSGRRLAYPAGKGSAATLPSMAPNKRRVR
jgi:hypothetical protein